MKRIILLLTLSIAGMGVYAQSNNKSMATQHSKQMNKKMQDCIMMKDGKMMVMKNNKTMMMDKDMTLSNGTVVMSDGSVKMKNGKTMMMKNGDCFYMNGKMTKMKMDKSMDKMEMNK